ncbi:MAG: hypothetical protein LIO74_11610 [Ruminococcus sp.]|nr:hypothetical protein [Ruminococcus sp.]
MFKKNWKRIIPTALAATLAATQAFSAMPTFAEDVSTYVYSTVNLPYADYYYGELTDVAENDTMDLSAEDPTASLRAEDPTASLRAEGYCDAVTSATNTKSVKYDATYYTENEDGSVTVEGI